MLPCYLFTSCIIFPSCSLCISSCLLWLHPSPQNYLCPKILPSHQSISILFTMRTTHLHSVQKDYSTVYSYIVLHDIFSKTRKNNSKYTLRKQRSINSFDRTITGRETTHHYPLWTWIKKFLTKCQKVESSICANGNYNEKEWFYLLKIIRTQFLSF